MSLNSLLRCGDGRRLDGQRATPRRGSLRRAVSECQGTPCENAQAMRLNGRRLYRSRDERVLAGVAGGVAKYFELDPALVRVAWAILILATGGAFLLLYIVMWLVVPEAPPEVADASAAPPDMPAGTPPSSIAQDWRAQSRARRGGSGSGAIVLGAILVLVGAWLLARAYFPLLDADRIWPVALILLGILLLVGALRPRP